jgi:type II secretory pathway pseudopilin PulG
MTQHSKTHFQRGTTLVEVLVAIALAGVMLPTLATALITSRAGRATSQQQLQATALLHEATEAVRMVQRTDWNAVAVDGTYHPTVSATDWALASGPETGNGFTREVVIASARRDSGGALVDTGGTVDPAAKHVTVTVSWQTPYDGAVSGELYLTRWTGNTVWQQTDQAAFAGGTLTNTAATNSGGGEVQLAAGVPSYQAAGTFESSVFDTGQTTALNRIDYTANTPAGTSVRLQIAVNTDNATWSYVGPDGTADTYFTAGSPLPLGAASGRYVRYKAFLDGPGTATPAVNDVTVNYSL